MTTNPSTIQNAIQRRYPNLTAAFYGPATASGILEAERKLGVELPSDFKDFYLLANGQQLDKFGCAVGIPCIPPLPFGGGSLESCTWGEFLSIDEIVRATFAHRELQEFDDPDYDGLELVGPVRIHRNHVIFCDPGTGDCIGLDLSPSPSGEVFQVVAINHDPFGFACLANSFTEFLNKVVDAIQSSDFVYSEEDGSFVAATEV